MKNKHMDIQDRNQIEKGLKEGLSFKAIARIIDKDCTTISKEVRQHSSLSDIVYYGRHFNDCVHRLDCKEKDACKFCMKTSATFCKFCGECFKHCDKYQQDECSLLQKAPYVCNGCENLRRCSLKKILYDAKQAQKDYEDNLSESRSGFYLTEKEIEQLNNLLVPLIKDQGQSIHHVYINHSDEIMMSEKKLYRVIDAGLLEVRNIDLPRKVRMRRRRDPNKTKFKIDKSCLEGRRPEDYEAFIKENPDLAVVQMDSVEGEKGGSCLLTIFFTNCNFMIAVKRKRNDSKSVTDWFEQVYEDLGAEVFKALFPVILTDNGSEFSNPSAIEFDKDGNRRTHVFYCHPSSPQEKGGCEVDHEFIRRIVYKGESFDEFKQKDINLMMSHINSCARAKLNDKAPILLFKALYSAELAEYFGLQEIDPDDINLTKTLLK